MLSYRCRKLLENVTRGGDYCPGLLESDKKGHGKIGMSQRFFVSSVSAR